jgi:death-on-curing protein
MEPIFLLLEEVLDIHQHQIEVYGGSLGIRDVGLLESALAMPQAGFGDQYFHEDLFMMAAAYLYHLTLNHPFVDGNKRVGLEAALMFLKHNGYTAYAGSDKDALIDLVLLVAQGQADKPTIAAFLRAHSRPL